VAITAVCALYITTKANCTAFLLIVFVVNDLIVLMDREYRLAGHVSLTRTRRFDVLFSSYYGNPFGSSELDQYLHELESYFPPSNRPLDLGIWFHDELAGTIFMSGVSGSPTALEFGYWITEEHEGKGIIYGIRSNCR